MSVGEDLIAYLTSKGLQVSRATGQEVVTHCVFCTDGDTKGRGKLYLNTSSWLYDCKRCETRGNRKTLLRHFGDEDDVAYLPDQDPYLRRKLLDEAATLAHEMLLGNEKQLEYLLVERGLSPEAIVKGRFGYVPMGFGLANSLPTFTSGKAKRLHLISAGLLTVGGSEFFQESITIPYFSHGQVVQLREKKIGGKYRTSSGDNVRLYNADAIRAADEVIITEGEFDAAILEQELASSADARMRSIGVVGLAGAGSWPPELEEMLDGVKRVFIGLDPDDTGRAAAVKLKAMLGSKGRTLDLPRELPKCDWTDYLRSKTDTNPHGGHTWRDVQTLVVEADLAGKRMFSIGEAAQKWENRRVQGTGGIKLGFVTMDAILRPGLMPGQVMIPLAKTGAGKSVFLSNILYNVRSHPTLHLSLELTAAEVYEHLYRIHHFWKPDASRDELMEDFANIRIVDQNRLSRGDLATFVYEFAEETGTPPDVLILDYLGYFARGFRGSSSYERTSDAVMEVKAIAKEFNLGVIAPHQVNRGAEDGKPLESDDSRDSGVIEETADFQLGLYRPGLMKKQDGTIEEDLTGAFNVGLLKSRHGGKGRVFNLRFSNLSLAICDATDRRAALRIEQENRLYRSGKHYLDYRQDRNQMGLEGIG
jgi:hypothetical protein